MVVVEGVEAVLLLMLAVRCRQSPRSVRRLRSDVRELNCVLLYFHHAAPGRCSDTMHRVIKSLRRLCGDAAWLTACCHRRHHPL
jgi:hypothetical protein